MRVRGLIAAAAVLAAMVFLNSTVVAAGPPEAPSTPGAHVSNRQIDCDEVIRKLDHDKRSRRGQAVSVTAVAKSLGTGAWWVERCMTAYGRRVPRRAEEVSGESVVEERLEHLEEDEAEEIAPEDAEQPGEQQEHPEKQLPPPPTPRHSNVEGEGY